MAQRVRLHGGPWHGQEADLPDDRDHFHVLQRDTRVAPQYVEEDPDAEIQTLPVREGIYSRVRNTDDFEWDGWVTRE